MLRAENSIACSFRPMCRFQSVLPMFSHLPPYPSIYLQYMPSPFQPLYSTFSTVVSMLGGDLYSSIMSPAGLSETDHTLNAPHPIPSLVWLDPSFPTSDKSRVNGTNYHSHSQTSDLTREYICTYPLAMARYLPAWD